VEVDYEAFIAIDNINCAEKIIEEDPIDVVKLLFRLIT
jgi:hypothetical protein